MADRKLCSSCDFFDYDEIWDGEEESQIFICKKGHFEYIGFNTDGCEDWKPKQWFKSPAEEEET